MIERTAEEQDTLTALIQRRARARPRAPAIIYQGHARSYAMLDRRGRRLAGGLDRLGVGPGDRVAIWLPTVPAWLELLLACARLRAIAVAVNTRFRSAEVADILHRSGAKVLVLWPGFKGIDFTAILSDVAPAALDRLESIVTYDEAGDRPPRRILDRDAVTYRVLEAAPAYQRDRAGSEAGCVMFTTSGTTKAPKLVLHGQAGVVRHGRDVAARFGYDRPGSVVLQAIPMCGVFGFAQAIGALAGGGALVMMPVFEAEEACRLIDAHRITAINGSDEMFARLLEARDREPPFPSLGFCGYANFTPALADIVARADRRGLRLVGLYGASEVLALYACQAPEADGAERSRMGGYPVSAQAKVRVRDPESGALLGPGEAGELELSGPSLMREYFADPEATAAALTDDGFVRTGDLGRLLDDGGFEFLSRIGDVLRLGGFLVNPQEIEDYIGQHPLVAGCQVIGVEGPRGARPVAFVIPRAHAAFSETALAAHCRAGLAGFKLPARFFPLASFPTTSGPNGTKIQRTKLRDMAVELLARAGDASSPAEGAP